MERSVVEMFEEAADKDLSELNFRSVPQMRELLFGDLGLKSTRKTDTGSASTSEAALEALRSQHPAVDQLLKFRQTKKMLETFEGWKKHQGTCEDNKVHPSLQQAR